MTSRETKRVHIEQAIARGHGIDQICEDLGVTEARVLAVMRRMDNIQHDRVIQPRGRTDRCTRGHDMNDPAIVYTRPDGGRECRPCKRRRAKERNHGLRGAA